MTGVLDREPAARSLQTAARRERIIAAAARLASVGGYDAVQMRDVAAEAGVALGTLYRQFSSKDQLLVATLAPRAADLAEGFAHHPPRGATPADRVADVVRQTSRAMEREPRLAAAMLTALSSSDTDTAAAKAEIYDSLTASIAAAIGDHAPVDLDAVGRVLGHAWFSAMSFWAGGLVDGRQMTDELTAAVQLLLPD